jgi:hypothetical protein
MALGSSEVPGAVWALRVPCQSTVALQAEAVSLEANRVSFDLFPPVLKRIVSRRGRPIMGRTPSADYLERRALTGRRCALDLHGATGLPHCTLSPVYGLVAVWAAEGREIDRARRALRLQRLEVSHREDPFGAVIRCTAEPAKADKRTRSKWSRVMRYAAAYKPDSEPLGQFIQRKGGINECAARLSRRPR